MSKLSLCSNGDHVAARVHNSRIYVAPPSSKQIVTLAFLEVYLFGGVSVVFPACVNIVVDKSAVESGEERGGWKRTRKRGGVFADWSAARSGDA